VVDRWDVERAVLYSQIPPLARLIVLALAIKSDNKTAVVPAEHTPSLTTLSAMTGISRGSLAEWLTALEAAGWVSRSKPVKRGSKTERTSYALGLGTNDVVLRDRSLRAPRPRKSIELAPEVDASSPRGGRDEPVAVVRLADLSAPASSPPGGPLLVRVADPSSPRRGHALTTHLPTEGGTTKNHHGARGAETIPNTPSVSAPRWAADNRKSTDAPKTAHASDALFPKPRRLNVDRLMEVHQMIHFWLEANGYRGFDESNLREIHTQLRAAHGTKLTTQYLRGILGNSGLAAFAEPIRERRHEKVAAMVRELQSAMPQCIHGTPAGNLPHPTTGDLLCLACRKGLPAAEPEDATNPAVQAILHAYRSSRGNDIRIKELIDITQQIEAFLAEGAKPEDLADLARKAGADRISLIQAAGVAA
jgi:hypothetical protein